MYSYGVKHVYMVLSAELSVCVCGGGGGAIHSCRITCERYVCSRAENSAI